MALRSGWKSVVLPEETAVATSYELWGLETCFKKPGELRDTGCVVLNLIYIKSISNDVKNCFARGLIL